MTHEKPITQLAGIVEIQLKDLLRSDRNVRTTSANSIAELAASIRARGLLQNVTVVAQLKKILEAISEGIGETNVEENRACSDGRTAPRPKSMAPQDLEIVIEKQKGAVGVNTASFQK